jgi:hypothetical protein
VGLVIALSGGIGSRRSDLAEKLEARLGWPRVKFSDLIRRRIEEAGEDAENRLLQQQYGQRLVQYQLDDFVGGTLAMAPHWVAAGNLIVDGLRHVEVLLTLRRLVNEAGSSVFYVHVRADPLEREAGARHRGIQEQDMFRYDHALSEAQMNRILPAYADLEVDGTLGLGLNLQDIEEKLRTKGVAIRG